VAPDDIKDTSGGRGECAFGPLGTGHVDLVQIVQILHSREFHGPYSLEIEGYAGEDLTREAQMSRIRQSLDYLARLGIKWATAS
jgi:sugar phosphate isomerase/epimerase